MKHRQKVLVLAVIALVAVGSACSRGDRIIKIADLPQTPDFEVDSRPQYAPLSMPAQKTHIDIGYTWKQNSLLFLPIFNDNGRYVAYTGSEAQYIEFKKGELEEWTAKANVTLSTNPSIPFWDAWGGKILLIVLIPPFAILSLLLDRLWRRISTGM
ncbi:MAG: hypothetical protein ABJB40_13285 [Acidobacteriota bacterium]